MVGVAASPPAAGSEVRRWPVPGPVASAGDPTANWSEARRAVLGVLRDRPRGIPARGIAVLLELSEHRVRQDLEALADQGFAGAQRAGDWGCDR